MSGHSIGPPVALVMVATGAIRLVITQSLRHGFEAGSMVKPALLGDVGPALEVESAELLVGLAEPVVDVVLAGQEVHRVREPQDELAVAFGVREGHLRVLPEVVRELEEPCPG
ncbi:hypothetical protein [Kribbella qitaiheensis]|uniref:hypothetical protein n=1 Tax=Kribbella qitaiheensis TaxID=1544730 RepID=UPI0016248C39|nr:hypothetical protein [Kribbella qitaiheensis]